MPPTPDRISCDWGFFVGASLVEEFFIWVFFIEAYLLRHGTTKSSNVLPLASAYFVKNMLSQRISEKKIGMAKIFTRISHSNFFNTDSERLFLTAVNDTTSFNPSDPNANWSAAFAASLAYPLPQNSLDNLQPISTPGLNEYSDLGFRA